MNLVELNHQTSFELTGSDRARFLQGRITCDVVAPLVGRGVYGFFPQIKGRILADACVLTEDDRLVVELPTERRDAILQHLQKYVLIDQVEMRPLDEVFFELLGDDVNTVLDCDLPDLRNHQKITLGGVDCRVVRLPDLGAPTFGLRVDRTDADALRSALLERGAQTITPEEWDGLRIVAGRPLYGRDFDESNFPQELEPWTEGDEGVSYTKGCYLGQEVIARIHYRGGVNKLLRGVLFETAEALTDDDAIREDRSAGKITSSTIVDDRRLGLSVLHTRVEPGMKVEVGGAVGEVLERPFQTGLF